MAAFAALLAAAACDDVESPPEQPSLTGRWVTVNTGNARWGDTLHLALVPVGDTLWRGTYVSTFVGGTSYTDSVTMTLHADSASGAFVHDMYRHGCAGPSRDCLRLWLLFRGELRADGTLVGELDDQLNRWPAVLRRE